MKKGLLLIAMVVFLTMSINDAYAQRVVKKYNQAVGANPLGLAFGFLNATYEQALSQENSFTVGLVIWGWPNNYSGWTAFGLSGSYRWYIFQENEKMLKGLSFGPLVSLGYWSHETGQWSSSSSLAVGGEVAYKWIFDNFYVEPNANIGFNLLSIDGLEDYVPFGIGVNLGYAW